MTVREHFSADWAFGIVHGMEKTVREAFPQDLRQWPLLQNFNFETYAVGEDHFVVVLRDKLSGVPSGPGVLQPFPHTGHPGLPVSASNVDQWLSYLTRKFELKNEDAVFVLPIHDSGRNDAAADFDMFTVAERELWDRQFQYTLARHVAGLKIPTHAAPPTSQSVTYNVSGVNARVNIGSFDSSVNIVEEVNAELFQKLLTAIAQANADIQLRSQLEEAVKAMKSTSGTSGFGAAYASFMSILADHIQVFGPIVAPYLPALAKLVT